MEAARLVRSSLWYLILLLSLRASLMEVKGLLPSSIPASAAIAHCQDPETLLSILSFI